MFGRGRGFDSGFKPRYWSKGQDAFERKLEKQARKEYPAPRYQYAKKPRTGPGYTRRVGNYGRYSGCATEQKFLDTFFTLGAISQDGEITGSLNEIAQNTTENGRIGRKAVIKSIQLRYTITLPSVHEQALSVPGDLIRVIVYLDTQCNGTAAVVEDVLEQEDELSFYNLNNKGRFDILMDKTHSINYLTLANDGAVAPATLYSQVEVVTHHQVAFNVNTPIEFNADLATGVISTIQSNNYGILYISTNDKALITVHRRLRFTDGG